MSGKELLAVLPNAWGVVVVCRLQRIVYDQMEYASINGSYAHGLSFGGYRVRQIPTRICISRERFETNIIAGKPSSAVLCCFKVSFTTKWKKKEKSSNRLTAAILKDFRLENMECCKYQLIFVTAKEVLSKPILFCLKIKKLFHLFTHRLYVCLFLLDDNASGF